MLKPRTLPNISEPSRAVGERLKFCDCCRKNDEWFNFKINKAVAGLGGVIPFLSRIAKLIALNTRLDMNSPNVFEKSNYPLRCGDVGLVHTTPKVRRGACAMSSDVAVQAPKPVLQGILRSRFRRWVQHPCLCHPRPPICLKETCRGVLMDEPHDRRMKIFNFYSICIPSSCPRDAADAV